MNGRKICPRCLLTKSGMQDILEDIKARIEKIPAKEKTPDDEYSGRLKICGECEFLADGTCLKCGCYPEFRAAFIKNRCPLKKW